MQELLLTDEKFYIELYRNRQVIGKSREELTARKCIGNDRLEYIKLMTTLEIRHALSYFKDGTILIQKHNPNT